MSIVIEGQVEISSLASSVSGRIVEEVDDISLNLGYHELLLTFLAMFAHASPSLTLPVPL
jgi:hypothetical protein